MLQGPCTGNQQSLAHSRLWDAVVGFLHVFAHMQMKLSQVSQWPLTKWVPATTLAYAVISSISLTCGVFYSLSNILFFQF